MQKLARTTMPVVLGVTLLVIGTASALRAFPSPVPEIDPASGISALTLLSGLVLIIRGRQKKA